MGYTKTVQFRGLVVPNAYHRIDTTSSADSLCTANVNIYSSREVFLNGEGYFEQMIVNYPISYGSGAGSDKNQGYEFLLNLDHNEGALPIFEGNQPD